MWETAPYGWVKRPIWRKNWQSAVLRLHLRYLVKRGFRERRSCRTHPHPWRRQFRRFVPSHQEFRLRLLSEFPDRQIIQLPQTIHFSSKASLKRAADIINSHKNFLILVRDVQSLNVARKEFTAPVDLCPDMAFCLGSQSSQAAITRKLLLLLRTDHEKVEQERSRPLPDFAAVEDWLTEQRGLGKWLFLRALLQTFLFVFKGRMPSELDVRIRWFHLLASNRVARGMKQVGSSAYVITDRLHTHIFCVLLNVPHSVLDNKLWKDQHVCRCVEQTLRKVGQAIEHECGRGCRNLS